MSKNLVFFCFALCARCPFEQTEASNLDQNVVATGVASFWEGALNSKSANKHLRRANMLVMGKQVRSTVESNTNVACVYLQPLL